MSDYHDRLTDEAFYRCGSCGGMVLLYSLCPRCEVRAEGSGDGHHDTAVAADTPQPTTDHIGPDNL